MKNKLIGGWTVTAAVATICLFGCVACVSAQPAAPDVALEAAAGPPPDPAVALPPNIAPDSPLGQVVKLVQAGVEVGVVKTFIVNSGSAFNLDAEKIITLNDLGVPTEIINVMMEHDKKFTVAATAPPPPAPAPATVVENSTLVAPDAPVTVEYFNNTLSPYGSWVMVEGYGRCWRPTAVIYDATWQPYSDRGHWVYSDCGWYWDSDYSWGATFHYGRWFRNDRFGWCWWPDTVWGPSWVTWRQSDAYCGWAPLPPFAIYRPGLGFSYRGANVAVGFDFGLSASCFTFVAVGNFCDRHPRYYRADSHRRDEIFHQTTVINNYHDNRTTVINGGIPVDRVRGATHRPLQPVAIHELPNAARQGWRGDNAEHSDRRPGNSPADNRPDRNAPGSPLRHDPASPAEHNNDASHRPGLGQPNPVPNRNGNINSPGRPQSPEASGIRSGQRDGGLNNPNANPAAAPQNPMPTGNNHPIAGTPITRQQPSPTTLVNPAPVQNLTPPANNRPTAGTPFVHNPSAPITVPVTPSAPVRPQPQDTVRQDRSFQTPVVRPEPPRPSPQIQQPQIITPPVVQAPPQRPLPVERQSPQVSVPRYVAPPSPPASPAPAPSQPRNANPPADHSSDRDKQKH